ncbi:MAG: glycosyltransferase [Desulfobacterales bacterium]
MAKRIAIVVSFSGQGGVERMMLNLAGGLVDQGCRVDLLPIKSEPHGVARISPGVRVVTPIGRHTWSSLPALARYLSREAPDALLSAKDRANRMAVIARWTARCNTRLVVRMGTTVSAALTSATGLKRWLWYRAMGWTYTRVDGIVAVSRGVAEDMARIAGIPRRRVTVIPNPVISSRLAALASEPPDHPWLRDNGPPVIVGMGRLTRQKDFSTLIRGVAQLQDLIPSRLIIIGDGKDRKALASLASALGIRDRVDFPGFLNNPYGILGKAHLFCLSSIWEGSPNALTEAMALGVPVVATDCPSGPMELLDGGRIAPLVPMRDPGALAEAMAKTLTDRPDGGELKRAVAAYTVENSARGYLKLLIPEADGP